MRSTTSPIVLNFKKENVSRERLPETWPNGASSLSVSVEGRELTEPSNLSPSLLFLTALSKLAVLTP